jgi:hypothetical protein
MGEERKDGMVFQGETNTGFCPWFAGVIAGYPGHSLGMGIALIITCPTAGIQF